MNRKRMSYEDRKNQILEPAMDVFLEKGFIKTTMEDIRKATGLSRGGLYHYYSNTFDLATDLIINNASELRFSNVLKFKEEHPEMSIEDIVVEVTLSKIFDRNDYKTLFVMLVIEKSTNPKIEAIYQKIMTEASEKFKEFVTTSGLPDLGALVDEYFYELLNALIIGVVVLDNNEIMLENKHYFREFIKNFINEKKKKRLNE